LNLYEPRGDARGVVALIHGGFWRAMYGPELFDDHARSLVADGFVVGNLAYRRVGERGGGWPNTGTDVAADLQALIDKCGTVDAVVGHSAGGHLALWAAAEVTPRPRVVISVGGCNDLALGQQMNIGQRAVDELLGGDLSQLASADPAQRLPLGTKTVLVVADDDRVVPNTLSESYAAKAAAASDDVAIRAVPGDHFSVLDITSSVWAAVVDEINASR
jgi:acetyl esterase/lipase